MSRQASAKWAWRCFTHGLAAIVLHCATSAGSSVGGNPNCQCLATFPSRLSARINSSCFILPGPLYTGRPDERDYCYPTDYGLNQCDLHDQFQPPFCVNPDGSARIDAPSWCTDSWCYVDSQNCVLPSSTMDLTASVIDEGYEGQGQLVYSYGTCGTSSSYAKFRRASLMNASEIVPIVEAYVSNMRDYIEAQFTVIADTEGVAACDDYADSCPCESCTPGQGGWRSAVDSSLLYDININRMTVTHTGDPVDRNSVNARHTQCLARLIEARLKVDIMLREYDDPTRMGWLMWGDQSSASWLGLPGIDWCAGDYDPRFRPWYVSAVSGPKDVIIILDRSNSMSTGVGASTRWALAVAAAEQVLDTLSEFDYVALVMFHSVSESFSSSQNLIPATYDNVESMRTWLRGTLPLGSTNFRAAFTTAFNIIRHTTVSSSCNGMVLFLTDGIDESDVEVSELNALNTRNYTIFTYSFGDEADTTKPKEIACANHGIWHHVPDGGDVNHAMANYYQYFSEGMASHKQIRWTAYRDYGVTENPLITGCLAAYNRSASPALLLGVFCMDVSIIIPVIDFEQKPDYDISWQTMRQQASACYLTQHSEQNLERLRGQYAPASRCEVNSRADASGASCGTTAHELRWPLLALLTIAFTRL